ncbi:hypothetical protein [uncultured Parasphingorhabdus sp.]|uniref:hypothetical protein n=1 Tax=uncultured Parasphingorhabdus sp. TaxID=2709694 RepID=UPI0012F3F9A1|nr:hypothetical protein [uncultured Parasphingorhabdus sp.]VWX59211.1 hypothetical protein SPHINGOR109_30352 [Sphingorhabdus sp. 109]
MAHIGQNRLDLSDSQINAKKATISIANIPTSNVAHDVPNERATAKVDSDPNIIIVAPQYSQRAPRKIAYPQQANKKI